MPPEESLEGSPQTRHVPGSGQCASEHKLTAFTLCGGTPDLGGKPAKDLGRITPIACVPNEQKAGRCVADRVDWNACSLQRGLFLCNARVKRQPQRDGRAVDDLTCHWRFSLEYDGMLKKSRRSVCALPHTMSAAFLKSRFEGRTGNGSARAATSPASFCEMRKTPRRNGYAVRSNGSCAAQTGHVDKPVFGTGMRNARSRRAAKTLESQDLRCCMGSAS